MMKDLRAGQQQHSSVNGNFALVSNHNKNIRATRSTVASTTIIGKTKRFIDGSGSGVITILRCDGNRNIMVKTFRDGSYTVQEELIYGSSTINT